MKMTPRCECEETCSGSFCTCPYVDEPSWWVEIEDRYARGTWERVTEGYTEQAALDAMAMEAASPGEDWTAVRVRDITTDVVVATVNLDSLKFIQTLLGDLS